MQNQKNLDIFRSRHSRLANSGSSEKYNISTQSYMVFIVDLSKLQSWQPTKVGQILLRHLIVIQLVDVRGPVNSWTEHLEEFPHF